jgi:hypothetical protein
VVGVAGEDGALQPGDDPAAAEADNGAENAGAVYVYSRSRLRSGDLTPFQYLKAFNCRANDYFGASVTLTDSQLIVGAPGEDGGNADDPADDSAALSGAAYVFTLQDGHFVFEQYLKPPAPILPNQGFGLACSADADLLAIGAPLETSATTVIDGPRGGSLSYDGATYLYRRVGSRWQFEAYLKPGNAHPNTLFGYSVRAAGGRVAVGAPGATNCPDEAPGVSARGAVYAFESRDVGWAVDACVSPSVGRGDFFGAGLGAFGDKLVVGAPWDASGRANDPSDASQTYSGAAYVEERSAAGWRKRAYLKAPNFASDDVFGGSIDLGARFAVVAASQRSRTESGQSDAVYSGAAYVFEVSPPAMP